ncbi:MAG: D-alanyl-D-alanine carboxypeptidase, partial [Acidobacteria bacterium]|nr:D-alanyl-D-alanine carboxypeptidase [Acidobacteriota bacterium]
ASPLAVINRATTSARGTRREITMRRPLGQSYVEVTGHIPADDAGDTVSVTTPRPALMFVSMLRAALERQGVQIKGRTLSVDAHAREISGRPFDAAKLVEIARRESAPFSEIAAKTMKPSQNLYTELILRTLGEQAQASPAAVGQTVAPARATATGQAATATGQTTATGHTAAPEQTDAQPRPSPAQPTPTPTRPPASATAGHAVVRQFLREAGVSHVEHLSFADGSGLARQNLITAGATVELLTYMSRHRHAGVWLDAQPVAGVDGTLRGRLRGTSAAGNLRAKTGTISNVSALSGYVTTAAGERLVFSTIVNHYTDERTPRTTFLDSIATLLASFAGRSQ